MRALCGSIITAGALIGLGLFSLGVGVRYQYFSERKEGVGGELDFVHLKNIDSPLGLCLTVLLLSLLIGLATAFIGLALHHERRHRERLRDMAALGGHTAGTTTPRATV